MEANKKFEEILKEKLRPKMPNLETNLIQNYEPFRYEITIPRQFVDHHTSKADSFAHQWYMTQAQNLKSQSFDEEVIPKEPPPIQEQSWEIVEPEDSGLEATQLSALGLVAFRTLTTLSSEPLPGRISETTLKSVKRALSKKLHPDLGGTADQFMQMLDALAILEDELEATTSTASDT